MDGIKKGGRANRDQRDARHAPRVPRGHHSYSLARRDGGATVREAVFLAALLALAFLLFGLAGGLDDEADLIEHARWMQELKEDGAWVMW